MNMSKHCLYSLALKDKDFKPVLAYGSAGTGKTYGAVGAAVDWIKSRKGKVIVTRPNVSFSDKNGYLPGTEREKMEPWIRPIQQLLRIHGIDTGEQEVAEKKGKLVYYPLEYIQGLTFDNSFIIVDECQNLTLDQIRVLVTRIGKWSKLVMCGDVAQVSPKFKGSGLEEFINMVECLNLNVHTIEFTSEDIVRSGICKEMIEAFEYWETLPRGNSKYA